MSGPKATCICAVCGKAEEMPIRFKREIPEDFEKVAATGLPAGWSIVESDVDDYDQPRYALVCDSLCAARLEETEG